MHVKSLIDKNQEFTEAEFNDFIGHEFNQLVYKCEGKIEEALAYAKGLCENVSKEFIRAMALHCTQYERGVILEPDFAFKLAMAIAARESRPDATAYTPRDIIGDITRATEEYFHSQSQEYSDED